MYKYIKVYSLGFDYVNWTRMSPVQRGDLRRIYKSHQINYYTAYPFHARFVNTVNI